MRVWVWVRVGGVVWVWVWVWVWMRGMDMGTGVRGKQAERIGDMLLTAPDVVPWSRALAAEGEKGGNTCRLVLNRTPSLGLHLMTLSAPSRLYNGPRSPRAL